MKRWLPLASVLVTTGCFGNPPADDAAVIPPLPDNCPGIFGQDVVPEYYVTIAPAELAALQDEFLHRPEREALGLDPEPYHPVELRYGSPTSELVPDVMLRLNGGSSWLWAVQLDANPKMQFVLSFNEVDPAGRFQGLRKVQLDMPRTDQTFLHQRVSLAYLRAAGVPAPCANNARLFLNGAYYGLYTNLERQDKEYLQRVFQAPGEADGDLWKGGRIIKTNEDTFTWDRIDALWNVTDVAELESLVDVEGSMQEWATEAVIGDADGYYNGHANFYVYDHPTRGFLWLPNDLDTVMDWDFMSPEAPLVIPPGPGRWERDWTHYLVAMGDPATLDQYVAALADARARYGVGAVQGNIDAWEAQIATAAAEDAHKPFTDDAHAFAVERMRDYAAARADYVDTWLSCWTSGGEDADGDGFDLCHDCDDHAGAVHPGAPEVCNQVDDDCDGHVDAVDGVSVCP